MLTPFRLASLVEQGFGPQIEFVSGLIEDGLTEVARAVAIRVENVAEAFYGISVTDDERVF